VDKQDTGTEEGKEAYRNVSGGAEAGASVEPVIVSELVDLNALSVSCLMRHRLCHHRRLSVPLWDNGMGSEQIGCEVGREIEMLRDGDIDHGLVKKSKSRHLIEKIARASEAKRAL